jgi:hypothetical protein
VTALTLADAITESFYAWETRGRGWTLADYPVALEPPFRPLFLLPQLTSDRLIRIDDGKRPTIVSFLIDSTRRLLSRTTAQAAPPEPYTEQVPFPALPGGSLSVLSISVPAGYAAHADAMAQLLSALSAATYPLAFELIGAAGKVTIQIVCADFDREQVRANIEGFLPDLAVTIEDDRLAACWDSSASHIVVDCGLAHEFFLPLPERDSFRVDPYVPLIPALAAAAQGEFLALQVLFAPTLNPWRTAIHEALDDGEGGCLIGDAPWFLPAASEKSETRLFAAVMRFAAQADSAERAWGLVRAPQPFVLQYARPDGNALLPLSNDDYPDDEHAASYLRRESNRTGMLLSAAELVSLVHMPDESVRHPAFVRGAFRTKVPSEGATGRDVIIGENRHRGVVSVAGIDSESRFAHTWIVGGSGSGKSTLLANLVLQDIALGHGIAVLDPHGDLIDDIAARIPEDRMSDVILFDPADVEYPVGFNILNARTEIERNLLASDLVAIFRRFATSWGDTMSTVLGEAILAILYHPKGGTLVELRRILIDAGFRKEYLAGVSDRDVRHFWEKEYALIGTKSIGPLLSRLDGFLRPRIVRHIVGQPNAKLDLADAMANGKVFLAKLSKGLIGEENAALLGSLLVAKLHQLALARQEIPKDQRRPFFCYADEFQHFVTPSMESLATEGRKYRFGLVLAHQTLAQLAEVPRIEHALLGNCHTRIVFRVGESDAKKLAGGFSFFEADDVARLSRGEAIARIGSAANDFNLRTYPLAAIDADDAEARKQALVAQSRERYAMRREEITELVASTPLTVAEEEAPESVEPATIAEPVDDARTAIPLTSQQVAPPTIRKPVTPPLMGRGGELHKYLQHLIKRLAEERGFRAAIEGAAHDGRADVVLTRGELSIGCEISVTTNVAHEEENLRKCIAAGFTRVLFVSPERRQRDKITAMLRSSLPNAPIDVLSPDDLVVALDAFGLAAETRETTVRGYKVKVTRQALTAADEASRRRAIAGVIARSVRK